MLQPFFGGRESQWAETWQELGDGVPTLAGFARLCSLAIATAPAVVPAISVEARTILYAARQRGLLEIKGANRAFDAPARLLAVHVETSPQQSIVFRNRENPELTIRFLAGFRDLCVAGFVMHHSFGDFSLSREGFAAAKTVDQAEVAALLQQGVPLDWE